MFIPKLISVLTVFLYLLVSNFAYAENHTIDMLNKLGKEKMVYSEKVISINYSTVFDEQKPRDRIRFRKPK